MVTFRFRSIITAARGTATSCCLSFVGPPPAQRTIKRVYLSDAKFKLFSGHLNLKRNLNDNHFFLQVFCRWW